MANDFTTRQWFIDTAYTWASLPAGHIAKGNVKIIEIIYTQEAVSTNPFSVQNKDGRVIFSGVGPADQSPVKSFKVSWVSGVQVPTLTSPGVILIAIE